MNDNSLKEAIRLAKKEKYARDFVCKHCGGTYFNKPMVRGNTAGVGFEAHSGFSCPEPSEFIRRWQYEMIQKILATGKPKSHTVFEYPAERNTA